MLRVGLTGGIGSGKTTVARIFESLGIPVFYPVSLLGDAPVYLVDGASGFGHVCEGPQNLF